MGKVIQWSYVASLYAIGKFIYNPLIKIKSKHEFWNVLWTIV